MKNGTSLCSNCITAPCTQSEGGREFIRFFFTSPFDLASLSEYIFSAYTDGYNAMLSYVSYSQHAQQSAEKYIHSLWSLDNEMAFSLLSNPSTYVVSASVASTLPITRDDVSILAKNDRVPIEEVKNLDNQSEGFSQGFPYWEEGEEARKSGQFEKAIKLYDLARYHGYDAPALYNSYAKAYRLMMDYDNEILILDEGISRLPSHANQWIARRDKAIKLLYEKKKNEANSKSASAPISKKVSTAREPRKSQKKAIVQMDENNHIICEYESLSAAAKAVGVNDKSIRDAAKGIQKHAAGFRWSYKE